MPDRQPVLAKTVTTTTGTGPYTLSTAALPAGDSHRTPHQAFLDGNLANGDTVFYMCRDTTLGNDDDKFFEYGIGIYTDGTNTVTRGTVLQSSDSNVAVNWGVGQRDFYFVTVPDPARLSGANIFTATQTVISGNTTVSLILSDVDTDATTKIVRAGTKHYLAAEEPVALFTAVNGLAISELTIGGASGLTNTVTKISFFTAANNTTVSGTERGFFNAVGDLTLNGTLIVENIQSADGNPYEHFAAGTTMIFFQASPPTGWTQNVTNTEAALRVVSGAGGGTGGSIALSGSSVSGSRAITIASMPAHTHAPSSGTFFRTADAAGAVQHSVEVGFRTDFFDTTTGSTGGGGSHNHSIDLKFIDVIEADKD